MAAFRLTNKAASAAPGYTLNAQSKEKGVTGRMDQTLEEAPNDTFKFQPLANGIRTNDRKQSKRPSAASAAAGGGRIPRTTKYARKAEKEIVAMAEAEKSEELPEASAPSSKRSYNFKSWVEPKRTITLNHLPEFDDGGSSSPDPIIGAGEEGSWTMPESRSAEVPEDLGHRPPVDLGHRPSVGYRHEAPVADEDAGIWAHSGNDEDRIPKVLVVDRQGWLAEQLAKATAGLQPPPEVLRLNRPTEVIDAVDQESPDVLVVAPREVTGAGLRRLADVHHAHPKVVVILSDNGKPISPVQTAACGTSDILPRNPTKARLRSRIARALETAEELRQEHLVVTERVVEIEVPPVPVPSPLATPRPKQVRQTGLARVFTVASASGGCGKTFFSTNLAAYLARATRGRVLLVDLDLQFGEVAIALHLRPQRTIAELVQEDDFAAALQDTVVSHRSGFKVLCAPKDPVAGDRVGPRETTAILEAARAEFDYIVVDTPPTLNETCLAAFDQSQSLVIMATMDLPSLKNLRIFLQTLEKLSLPADQVSVVINKAESGTGIDLNEVEPLYPQGFSAVLPYARQVSWSLNMGAPIIESDPNAEISRKIAEATIKLLPPSPGVVLPWGPSNTAPRRRGWFMRLLKGSAA